jgi:hypothetical protein
LLFLIIRPPNSKSEAAGTYHRRYRTQ